MAGLFRQHCDRCKQHPVAAQGARYLSERTNNADQSTDSADEQDANQLSGFAKSFREMTEIAENIDKPIKDTTPFPELLRKSTFFDVCKYYRLGQFCTVSKSESTPNSMISFSSRLDGRSTRQSGGGYDLSYGLRRLIRRLRLEVALHLFEASKTRTVSSFQLSFHSHIPHLLFEWLF